jgi:small subunit ribosomal protein S16
MVKLRFTRLGKAHQPVYRLIAIQARTKRDGEALEQLGKYNPRNKPTTFEYDKDRVKYWLSVGAQPTYTVGRLLAKDGLLKLEAKKFNTKPGRKAQERAEKKAAKAAEAKAE